MRREMLRRRLSPRTVESYCFYAEEVPQKIRQKSKEHNKERDKGISVLSC
jgi:hypothetical protein